MVIKDYIINYSSYVNKLNLHCLSNFMDTFDHKQPQKSVASCYFRLLFNQSALVDVIQVRSIAFLTLNEQLIFVSISTCFDSL